MQLTGGAGTASASTVASDIAFAFAYPFVLDGWREAGAEILPFSPLADEPPDAVADERPNDAVLVGLDGVFDRLADVAEWSTHLDRFDAAPRGFLCDLYELAAFGVDVSDEECGVGVAVDSADPPGDVDIADVAFLERAGVGNAVADHFVDRRAAGFRVSVVVDRRRVGAALEQAAGLDQIGHEHAVDEEAGAAFHNYGQLVDGGDEGAGVAHLFLAASLAANDLDQRQFRHRIEEVETHDSVRPFRRSGHIRDRERRSIRGEDGFGSAKTVESGEEFILRLHALYDGLDDQVALR